MKSFNLQDIEYPKTYEIDEDTAFVKLKKKKRQKSKNKVKKMKKTKIE